MGYLSIKEIVLVPKDDFKGKKGNRIEKYFKYFILYPCLMWRNYK